MRSNDVGSTGPPPTNIERVEVQDKYSSSGIIKVGYNASVDLAKSANPTWMETTRLNPNESCLAQRYGCVPHTGVGPTMMKSVPAAKKIQSFCDEDVKWKTLCEFIWIIRDNFGWSDEQVARLLKEVCHGRARNAIELMNTDDRATLNLVLKVL